MLMKFIDLPTITRDQTAEILGAMVDLSCSAAPLVTITPQERCSLPRVGSCREGFARACLDAAEQHSECIPRNIDPQPMIRGLTVHGGLRDLSALLRELLQQVDDTRHHLGSEIFGSSLEIYHLLKMARGRDAELSQVVCEMKTRLRARSAKKEALAVLPAPASDA